MCSTRPPYRLSTTCDFALRTSDGDVFYIAKGVLTNVSSVFADMFSLSNLHADERIDGKPVVDVQEHGQTWEHILGLCYLILPAPPAMDDVHALLEAARKYDIGVLKEWTRRQLSLPRYYDSYALRVYALACAYGLEDVARLAARASLALPKHLPYVDEFDLTRTRSYHHLLEYRRSCTEAVRRVLIWPASDKPPAWMLDGAMRITIMPIAAPVYPFKPNPVAGNGSLRCCVAFQAGMNMLGYAIDGQIKSTPSFNAPLLTGVLPHCEEASLALDKIAKFAEILDKQIAKAIADVTLEWTE